MSLDPIKKKVLFDALRDVKDFPKEGIIFKDITTLLNDKDAYALLMNHLKEHYQNSKIDYVAGIDARGFIFGAALAQMLGCGFVPIRKAGKLPYTTVSEKYALEYGFDEVQLHIDAFGEKKGANVLLIDDLIATGGTAIAAANLIKKVGANLVDSCFIIELEFLDGKKKLQEISSVYSVLGVN